VNDLIVFAISQSTHFSNKIAKGMIERGWVDYHSEDCVFSKSLTIYQ
jgi:hypothetical protein